jgi:DNA (cytosine-5)-methyltransferase 1
MFLIIDGTRVNDVRVYEDGIVPTVVARYGTGGGNVPMIFDNSEPNETIAFDTQFGSNANTFENVSPTLKASQQPPSFIEANVSVFPIQGTVIGRADTSGPQGKGYGSETDPMFTLDRVSGHGVATEATVRRLTPMECERLQGFPDGWTDGQADSNRYKQMGNAVAVPVVQWIINGLVGNR